MAEFNPFGQLMEVQRYKQNLRMKQNAIAQQNFMQMNQLYNQARDRQNAMYQNQQATDTAQRRQGTLEMTLGNVPPERRQEELISRGFLGEAKTLAGMAPKPATPTTHAKLITERNALAEKLGEDHPLIESYDSKISGQDVSIEEMTPEEISYHAHIYNKFGKMVNVGRGKAATKIKAAIGKEAARVALARGDISPERAAAGTGGKRADIKAIGSSITQQTKQLGAMRSFVINMQDQIGRVGKLAEELKTFDARLLNVPLRALRGRWAGSADQAIYDLYLTEIEGEAGKLATGSAASVAELSQGAQEKWARIHDKNLSLADMMKLLNETGHAGQIRVNSVIQALDQSKGELRNVGRKAPAAPQQPAKVVNWSDL